MPKHTQRTADSQSFQRLDDTSQRMRIILTMNDMDGDKNSRQQPYKSTRRTKSRCFAPHFFILGYIGQTLIGKRDSMIIVRTPHQPRQTLHVFFRQVRIRRQSAKSLLFLRS